MYIGVHPKDECTRYLRGRRICSMDAWWRIYNFQTYPKPDPNVIVKKVRNEVFVLKYRSLDKLTDMDVYLNRPSSMGNFLYEEFFTRFIVVFEQPKYGEFFEILKNAGYSKSIFVKKRKNPANVLVRLEMVAFSSGELWYLREILRHKAFRSFEEARTVVCPLTKESIVCETFQMAAVQEGYVLEGRECILCFHEAMISSSSKQLRQLFVMQTLNGYPTVLVFTDTLCVEAMEQDFLIQFRDANLARQKLLEDLQERLYSDGNGKKLKDFGLPEPKENVTELDRERIRYTRNSETETYRELCEKGKIYIV